ncbi:MAG TPA: hypothetical protein H9879_08845 [Candidatus Alistipes intestinipullorum]|nr:hypothetical protein [Candidatus Alistipes intestinipullorum]
MKKFLSLHVLLLSMLLVACDKNYYYIDDTTIDLKAQNIEAVGTLFYNMARQPEEAEQLISIAETTLFNRYTDLLPISDRAVDQRGTARGSAIGQLATALTRASEEMKQQLFDAADQFLGPYDPKIISPALNAYAITTASNQIIEAYAYNPQMFADLQELCETYLGIELEAIARN